MDKTLILLTQLEARVKLLETRLALSLTNERSDLGGRVISQQDLVSGTFPINNAALVENTGTSLIPLFSGTRVVKDSSSTDRTVTIVNGSIKDWEA